MTSLQDLLKINQDDNFFAKMSERPRAPLGVYLRWLVLSEEIKLFEKSGLYAVAMKIAPLADPEDANSKDESRSVLHSLFFPRPAAGEQKEMDGSFNWQQMVDGVGGSPRSCLPGEMFSDVGPIPSRAKYLGKGLPGAIVDGVKVDGAAAEARGKERREYIRRLQGRILEYAVKNGEKCPPLFEGAAFYAVAGLDDKEGKYVNLVTKVGKVYKDFSPTLPLGETLGTLD